MYRDPVGDRRDGRVGAGRGGGDDDEVFEVVRWEKR